MSLVLKVDLGPQILSNYLIFPQYFHCSLALQGAGELMRDQLSGSVILAFDGSTTAMVNVQSGLEKFIAIAAETRSAATPDVPTLREHGAGL